MDVLTQGLAGAVVAGSLAGREQMRTAAAIGFFAGLLGDVRYAMLPNSTLPLWGIKLDLARQDSHVEFMTFRLADGKTRQAFMDMLAGRPVSGVE